MQRMIEKAFFALLCFEINGEELQDELNNLITPEILPALFKLAKRHDLAHLMVMLWIKTDCWKRARKPKSVSCENGIWRFTVMNKSSMNLNKFAMRW